MRGPVKRLTFSVLEIPTLTHWGFAILTAALAGLGLLSLRRS